MSEPKDVLIPTVLIVGAGLGGLMLGAILENANISYHILERATELRPLGSGIALTGNILPLFEQLGIYEELKSISLPYVSTEYYDVKLKDLGSTGSKEHNLIPKLQNLLRQQVPAHKISMGKKVLRFKEYDKNVIVYCSDNTTFECSVLVGADGTYSAVRQNIYKQLEEEGSLTFGDKSSFSIGYITMVGISSHPPEKYPQLSDTTRTHFRLVIGEKSDSGYVATAPDNQICWGVQLQLPGNKANDQHFRNSEWGPESIDSMLKQFQDFPCGFGGTMKDIFDATPKGSICKVFLEEKVFQTWYHGRSVLIGDACHKAIYREEDFLPGAGQGNKRPMLPFLENSTRDINQ
ncbi:hypothetical protein BGX21_004831 [Mortierella sp. AD011]|nr:hypothetical protein BGX21_004831 [Mortierella sp. AD011]